MFLVERPPARPRRRLPGVIELFLAPLVVPAVGVTDDARTRDACDDPVRPAGRTGGAAGLRARHLDD
ncbi:MAG: hypothetical protein M0P31_06165 [Solirubrobacteraceae bacterium]|nr:hypothetical protein [Solirubrobacteraceae bacterium]